MRVVEYHSNSDIRIVEFPVPEIGPGELLVQLRACGLCASDVMEWYMQPRAPLYPGHEPVGVVVATGEGVQRFSVGERVFMHHHVPCMVCHYCRRGSFSQCATFRATRLFPGGLAEYISVPALNVQLDVLSLPNELTDEAATLIEPLACCIRGISRANIQAGDSVLVLGAGSNGLMLAQLARQRGAVRVIIVDPIAYRRQRALDGGIDHALDHGRHSIGTGLRSQRQPQTRHCDCDAIKYTGYAARYRTGRTGWHSPALCSTSSDRNVAC